MKVFKCITEGAFVLLAGVVATLSLNGCKAAPAEENVFIPPEYSSMMTQMSNNRADKTWGDPKSILPYNKIQIAVIVSKKQLKASTWANMNIREKSKNQDLNDLAVYAANSFKKAFKNSKKFILVDKPGPKTMALEFAIVQAIPNKPILGAISNLTNLTPIGILLLPIKLGVSSSSEGHGVIAMESVFRDSESGRILAVVADREQSNVAYFNTKDFTAYGGARQVIDMWTNNMVSALDQIKTTGHRADLKPRSTLSFFN